MANRLIIGDYAYSSWSLRGWLLLQRFGLHADITLVDFKAGGVAEQLAQVPPARTVPTLVLDDGTVVWDSLAIAEELASRHPLAGHWPADPAARATARAVSAEMHSGFSALRNDCPMNLRRSYIGYPVADGVRADLDRLEALWSFARARFGKGGPWLFGGYSVADAFFAPVAARIAGYRLPVGPEAQAYVAAHLADPAFRRWRAMGLVRGDDLPWYAKPQDSGDWPGPAPLAAKAVPQGPAVNSACPYSGRPVTHFLICRDRVWGFCNAFCRDKTAADPLAWPEFARLLDGEGP